MPNRSGMQRSSDMNSSEESERIIAVITAQLQEMRTEMGNMRKDFLDTISQNKAEIKGLKNDVNLLKSRLTKVEEKLGDAEAELKLNNAIFSGDDIPVRTIGEDCKEIIRELVTNKLRKVIASSDIESAFRVGKPKTDSTNQITANRRCPILVKFRSPETKRSILESCRAIKPKFYVNDDLPPVKQTIMYVLRLTKKKFPGIVSGCSSSNGHIYAWVKPENSSETTRNRKIMVNTLDKLTMFCSSVVGAGLESFISVWPH